ncbi:hypothetical protein [Ralstonia pseudosolanacearum]|uniref:hypothetical protein n=1 Tax=Ralstonia pseudosolanacearum TaxID=1310165 RepID=UPI001FFA226C|nr:hypothetical protein [Ralstonia pseudosolanacearum]
MKKALDSSRAFFFGSRDRCHRPVSHFLWITTLHLPSHLAKSRHGVFYFRLTFRTGGVTTERRISLRTKNPQEARFKALSLGIMTVRKQEQLRGAVLDYLSTAGNIAGQRPDSDFLLNLLHRVDRQRLAELAGLSLETVNDLLAEPAAPDTRRLDIEVGVGGLSLRNINSDEDMGRAVHILKALNLSPEALAALITSNPTHAQTAPVLATPPAVPQPSTTEAGGTTIQEMVPRFATRKRNKLSGPLILRIP